MVLLVQLGLMIRYTTWLRVFQLRLLKSVKQKQGDLHMQSQKGIYVNKSALEMGALGVKLQLQWLWGVGPFIFQPGDKSGVSRKKSGKYTCIITFAASSDVVASKKLTSTFYVVSKR